MRFRSVLAWVPVVVLFAACGSDDSEGDGTGGKTTCAPGATQACTCNGSDTGAQVCAADGKSWGACDCGSAGSGGSGGASGDASTGGSGGAMGGTGATGGAGGSSGSAGDSGPDGSANSDPCPTEPVDVDCSSDCGGPAATCTDTPPPSCEGLLWVDNENKKEKYVLRTASPPHAERPACCPGHYGGYVAVFTLPGGSAYKLTVGKPWIVSYWEDGSYCAPLHKGCVVSEGSADGHFIIATDDPNADVRNIVIEALPGFPTCAASDYWQ